MLSTCNRLEVYAEVPAFHPAVAAIGEALALARRVSRPAAAPPHRAEVLADHLYVRHDEGAVAHAFTVACGLDSMAVGEAQVLGQMRDALAGPRRAGRSASRSTRSSSRPCGSASARTPRPTSTSTACRSCTSPSSRLPSRLGDLTGAAPPSSVPADERAGRGHPARRASVALVANRTAARRAARRGHGGRAAVGRAARRRGRGDLVITCTGPSGTSSRARPRRRATARRPPQVVVDLALPRDVEPSATTAPDALVARRPRRASSSGRSRPHRGRRACATRHGRGGRIPHPAHGEDGHADGRRTARARCRARRR